MKEAGACGTLNGLGLAVMLWVRLRPHLGPLGSHRAASRAGASPRRRSEVDGAIWHVLGWVGSRDGRAGIVVHGDASGQVFPTPAGVDAPGGPLTVHGAHG